MGNINIHNDIQFKSSRSLFDRISKRLASYDAQGLLDEGDFPKHVKSLLDKLGWAVYKECYAIIPVINYKVKLPQGYKSFWAAYKCSPDCSNSAPSINEQRPYIYYTDTEISREASNNGCSVNYIDDGSRTKIVVRTFVNGDDFVSNYNYGTLLTLVGTIEDECDLDSPCRTNHSSGQISLQNGYIQTNFNDDNIYLQYYGLPLDEKGMPMIPDVDEIEQAIEYYILKNIFEDLYFNSSVPGIADFLKYVKEEYDHTYFPQAHYYCKLPKFQTMVDLLRKQRKSKKFYYSAFDRTLAHHRL